MDNLSYRNSRTAQRSSSEQREVPARQDPVDAPNAAAAPSAPKNYRSNVDEKPPKKKKRIIIGAILLALVLSLIGMLVVFGNMARGDAPAIDTKKYQAIFLRNGQIYFGKLTPVNKDYMKLNDVFYLRTQSTGSDEAKDSQADATNSQGDVQLIKLGNEVHGPDDEMVVNRNEVMYYENLKADGKVSQAIEKYKSSN